MIFPRLAVPLLFSFLPMVAVSAPLDEKEQAMMQWIDAHVEESIDLLEKSTNINSGTNNHAGVRAVGDILRGELDALDFKTRWIDFPQEVKSAGHLFARRTGNGGKKLLLIGHLDTVFEQDDSFQTFVRDGDSATGPGVEDMKSGNLIILYAL
jgi:glutamate carboxypeptidase